MTGEYRLGKLTWPQIKDVLPSVHAVLIPVGSTEQHGRHLSVDNDYFSSETLCKMIAQNAQDGGLRVLVAPTVTYGISWYHTNFPGTVSLSQQTFMRVIKEVCEGLINQGFKNLIIFNSHGGNTPALTVAINEIYEKLKHRVMLCQWWSLSAEVLQKRGIRTPLLHAEEAETSLAMAIGGTIVLEELSRAAFERKKALREVGVPTSKHISYDQLSPGSGVLIPMDYIDDISATGVVGDATAANKATGEAMLQNIIEKTIDLIKDINA